MPYPDYIPTRVVSIGGAAVLESGSLLKVQVAIVSSRSLVWDATGYRFERGGVAVQSELGSEVQLILPRTDVPGWKDAATGAVLDVSAPDAYSHRYTATVRFADSNDRTAVGAGSYEIGPFVVPEGEGAIDLDKLVPASTVAGDAISIPDLWGQLVADAQAAASDAQAALVDSDAFIASQIGTPGTATETELKATIVEVGGENFATSDEVDAAYGVATRGSTHNRARTASMLGFFGATGHGFTSNTMASNGTVNLNDTSQPMLGSQCVSVTYGTNGTGSGAAISKSTFTPFSITDKYIRVTFRHTGTIGGFVLYFASDTGYVNRYQTSWYSPSAYPADMDHTIDIPLSHFTTSGSPDPAAIVAARIIVAPSPGNAGAGWVGQIALVNAPTSVLPNGGVILSFDDTFLAHYSIARPKLAQYGYAGTLYPIQSALTTDHNPALHYSVAQAQYMQAVHGWDIGYHASTAASHSIGVSPGVPEADIRAELEAIIAFNKLYSFRGDSYAYPNTAQDPEAQRVVGDYCRTARGGGAIFTETHPAGNPMNIRAKNAGGLTLAQMKTFVDQAKAGKSIAHLFFHDLPTTKVAANDVARQDFYDLVDYVAAQGVPVFTASQAAALPAAA